MEFVDQLSSANAHLHVLLKEMHHSKAHDGEKLEEFHPKLSEAMHKARHVSDQLEQVIDDSLWPLPKYAEILFMK